MGHCPRFWGGLNYPQRCCTRPNSQGVRKQESGGTHWRRCQRRLRRPARPVRRDLTTAELAELDKLGLSPSERLTKTREWQHQPPPPDAA